MLIGTPYLYFFNELEFNNYRYFENISIRSDVFQ